MRYRLLTIVWLGATACDGAHVKTVSLPETSVPSASSAPVAAASSAAPVSIPAAFFPPHTFSDATDAFVSQWYGKHLDAMHEPSMWATATRGETAYRFVWLRTWGKPMAVRITRVGDHGHLVVTRLSGNGGYDPGTVDAKRERDLTAAEWKRVEDAIAAASFDTTATEGAMGNDGAQWIIERAKPGAYRLVERWSPTYDAASAAKNAAFVRACDLFLDLAGRDLVTGDVY
jgi:hypothetical protein